MASGLQDRPHKCRLSHRHRRAVWNTSRWGKPGTCKRKQAAKMRPFHEVISNSILVVKGDL